MYLKSLSNPSNSNGNLLYLHSRIVFVRLQHTLLMKIHGNLNNEFVIQDLFKHLVNV